MTDVAEHAAPGPVAGDDPIRLLRQWVAAPRPPEMTLCTASAVGDPHARTVIIGEIDAAALYLTSSPSQKTRDIAARPRVAGVFRLPRCEIRWEGAATILRDTDRTRAEFAACSLWLRRVVCMYAALGGDIDGDGSDRAFRPDELARAFDAAGDAHDMPPGWVTIRLVPDAVTFWQAGSGLAPPTVTRFVHTDGCWRHYNVLP